MSAGSGLARTAAFTALYVVATFGGRMTVLDGTNLSLVWPAAGVAAAWFCVQRRSRWRWLDAVALAAVTMVVNMATGVSGSLAAAFVVANLLQAWLFAVLFERFCPHLWGVGGDRVMERLSDLWGLLAAAFVSTLAGAAIGPTAVWWVNGAQSWAATAVWLTRNTVSIIVIGAVGLRLGYLVAHGRLPGTPLAAVRAIVAAWRRRRWGTVEYVALTIVSTGAYVIGFGVNHGLPLAFPLLIVTVWAALRLSTTFVVLHDMMQGGVAILFTLSGDGPFAEIGSHTARALVAQLFVGMVAVVGLALALSRDERVALLHRLAEGEREASDQARLMTTIVESMSDGLAVVAGDGRIVMRNGAAAALLGGRVSPGGTLAEPEHYGLMHLDGTPVAPAEMAYHRALAGQDIRGVDFLVRNAGVPDGRIVSVDATVLPPDAHGARHAVVLFHDVTAERRQRDELAAFAGVVAHDLLNPLATIDGWAETAADTLHTAPEHPDVADAQDALVRIGRAATRMRALINDLLAYTTARDATITPVDLSLRPIVDDIAVARADLAAGANVPPPRFTVGELAPVHADPVLARQLLDNLISNAIKYTAAGTVPHVTITTTVTPDGCVELVVADNGIGIPAGQHRAIFGNFHRAHRATGYTGTGLGLAICERIVQRHGGTISAEDNPGGGSIFRVKLPAAEARWSLAGAREVQPRPAGAGAAR